MIEGLAEMAVANAGLLLAAHALLRRIRTDDAPVNAVLFVLVHLTLVSVAVLAAGTAGVLTPRALGLSGAVLLGILLILKEHRFVRLPPKPEIGRATALLAALVGVRMLAQVWLLSPSNYDALSYHLTKVAEWVRAGAFTREMGPDYCAPFPAGLELIETWWVVFLHHDVLIEMAGVEFAVLAFLAVRLLAVRLGLASRPAFLAATLYLLVPAFTLQTISCLNDGAVAALVVSLAALITARIHPVVLLVPLGLIAGIKATGLFTMPGWVLLAVLHRKDPLLRPASVRTAIAVAAGALVAGAFWYGRNLLWYGNPVHPVDAAIDTVDELRYPVQRGASLLSLRYNLAYFVTSLVYDKESGLSAFTYKTAGWGIVCFSIGILALLQELRKDRGFRTLAAATAVSMVVVFLMVRNDYWYARYVLFAPALLCIAAAKLAATARPVAVLVGLGALLQFASTMLPNELPPKEALAVMKQPWRERSARVILPPPPTDPIGVCATMRCPSYLLYGPDLSRRVVYVRVSAVRDLAAELERQGLQASYVRLPPRAMHDLDQLVQEGRFRDLGNGYYGLR